MTGKKFEVGKVYRCPKTIVDSGFIKIIGYDPNTINPLLPLKKKGDYLVREFIPKENRCVYTEPWYCSLEELEKWNE